MLSKVVEQLAVLDKARLEPDTIIVIGCRRTTSFPQFALAHQTPAYSSDRNTDLPVVTTSALLAQLARETTTRPGSSLDVRRRGRTGA